MQRLERVSAAVANALRILPVAGEPGFMSPGGIAAGLADILRAHTGPCERLCIASGGGAGAGPGGQRRPDMTGNIRNRLERLESELDQPQTTPAALPKR